MPSRTIVATNADGSTRNIVIPDRSRYAGVRKYNTGTLQDAKTISTPSASDYTVTKTDDRNFRIVANSNSSTKYINIHPASFLGNYLITFDLVLNSGSFTNSGFKIAYLDEEESSNFGSGSSPTGDLILTQGSNAHSISVENDGVGQSPKMYLRIGSGNTFDVSINNLAIHKDGKAMTIDRTASAKKADRAGESRPLLSKVVGGAAAAYSLRDLNDKAGNSKVVRVRRESDNDERDFSAKDVRNGTLQNWVNSQATLPLDLQTLTADGRTGSVIGAQAAYSLRNLSKNYTGNVVEVRRNTDGATRNFTATEIADESTIENWVNTSFTSSLPLDVQGSAQAAYSLRSLGTNQATIPNDPNSPLNEDTNVPESGKYVVQVRRSSDNTIKSFKADEVTDGTLEAFVNNVTIYQSDFSAGVNGFNETSTTNLTGNQDGVSDEAGTTKDNVLKAVKVNDTQGYFQRDQGVVAGLTYTVSGTFFAPTSNTAVDGIMIKDGTSGGVSASYPSGYLTSSGVWTDFSFSYTPTTSGIQRINFGVSSLGANPNGTSTGSAGDIVYLSDLKFVETTSNGFVRTWYDQSGNSNHATQGTAGSQPKIVDAGSLLTDGGLLFDGVDDYLDSTSNISSPLWSFITHKATKDNSAVFATKNGDRWLGRRSSGTFLQILTSVVSGGSYPSSTIIRTDEVNGSDSKIFSNGTSVVTGDSGSAQSNFGRIGAQGQLSDTKFLGGNIQELIVYTSDVSGKRRAIEESIATNYGITLASFSRDGHVKTWYDQSGSNFHAIQDTTTLQPKIVENGLLTKNELGNPSIKLAGTGDHLLHTITDSTKYLSQNQEISLISFSDKSSKTRSPLSLYSSISGGSRYFHISEGTGTSNFHARNTANKSVPASASGNVRLTTGITTSDTDYKVASMGGAFVSSTDDYGNNLTASHRLDQIFIGKFRPTQTDSFHGFITELLVYNSDQTDNRTALEANIAEHYGISGVPTATDTVNGFVEAWYDQSGNNFDMLQSTSTKQPLIVENGVFLGSVKYDGSTNYLKAATTLDISNQSVSLFSVQTRGAGPHQSTMGKHNSGRGISFENTISRVFVTGNQNLISHSSDGTGFLLGTAIHTGDGSSDQIHLFRNSILKTETNQSVFDVQAEAEPIHATTYNILGGNRTETTNSNFFEGEIKEVIIYKANHMANRPAIEANLNNQYSVY